MAKKITIYSTQTCPACTELKEFLQSKSVGFEVVDVGTSAEGLKKMKEMSGQIGVPVIDVDGKIFVGFNKKELSKELGIDEQL